MITIRRMTRADLDFAMTVKRAADWNQTEDDWLAHLAADPAGCFIAELAGEPAGTAVLSNYGNEFGWIGMVLVRPSFRRRGVGGALLRATRDHARDAGIPRVRLDATPAGRQVYLTQGFVDEYPLTRYRGVAGAAEPARVDRVDSDDVEMVDQLAVWDTARFGADRGTVLRELVVRPGSTTFYVHNGKLAGFLVARRGSGATQLGPWLSDDPDTAGLLLRAALTQLRGSEVIVDVPQSNTEATRLVERCGLGAERGFTRMSLPAGQVLEDNQRIYATGGADRG